MRNQRKIREVNNKSKLLKQNYTIFFKNNKQRTNKQTTKVIVFYYRVRKQSAAMVSIPTTSH